jgi:uncharacterized protein
MSTRILRGRDVWWLLGLGGVAAVPDAYVVDGALIPDARAHIERAGLFVPPRDDIYYLTVLTATACNLGCAYCFQNTQAAQPGGNNPPRIASRTLSAHTIDRIVTFARTSMARSARTGLHILLFGGEPLLNPVGAVRLLEASTHIGLQSAEMVTNGTLLLPRTAQRLEAAGLSRVQITFDGDRTSHDALRVTRAGRPTFDLIVDNVARTAAVTAMHWIFRINVADPAALDIPSLLSHLAQTVDPTHASVSLHLIDDVGVGFHDNRTFADWQATAQRFVEWNSMAAALGFNLPLPTPRRPCVYCSDPEGRAGAVINADGVLYSCWETAGKPGWEVGDINTGYRVGVGSRWVSCGYAARSRWSTGDQRRFADHVDAANLDHNPLLAGIR